MVPNVPSKTAREDRPVYNLISQGAAMGVAASKRLHASNPGPQIKGSQGKGRCGAGLGQTCAMHSSTLAALATRGAERHWVDGS